MKITNKHLWSSLALSAALFLSACNGNEETVKTKAEESTKVRSRYN